MSTEAHASRLAETTFYWFSSQIWSAAEHIAVEGYRGDDVQETKLAIAKAINDAVMAERERCAKIADDAAAGRDWQRSDANAHNDKRAARDFETMKFEAIEIASAIRLPIPAAPKAEG